MIKQQVDVLFMDGELMLGDTLRLYKGDNGILISVKVEKQYYKNNKLITENLIELGKYGRAIIRKGQHDCPIHNEENEEPVYCSEVAKIKDGRLDILIPKEAIDETSEMGTYQIQIQLFGNDTDLGRPRLTLDPFEFEACDLISEDLELDDPIFTDVPIVGIGEASEAILREDGDLPIKLEDGSFNKTEWKTNDVITAGRLNKMENAMKSVYGIRAKSLTSGSLNKHIADIINNLIEAPSLDNRIYTLISGTVHVDLSDGKIVVINEGSERNEGILDFTLVPAGLVKKAKVKFTLTTNKALIIGDFSLNMGDEAAILDNDKIHIIEGVDMTGIATETYVARKVDEAIDSIDTLEVTTIGNDGIMLLADGDGYEVFDLNLDNVKPNQENHFVFKKVKIPCKDANGNDNTLYFDDTFVCITVIDGIVYEIKEFRSGIVHSITKSENNNVLEYSSRPMTDVEYEHLRDINKIEEANAIEYFKNYFTRDGLYYFGNVSIKCIVGGKSKIVYFNERLVEITIYNSYLTLYDYKDCLIYKFNHNGSKITGFVGQGELTDAHEIRLNEKVSSAINNNIVPVYATKKELNDALSNIEIPEVDLSGYATKEEVPSVEGLASEEFVDEAISNIHTLEVKTIGSDVMLIDDGDGYTEFDIDAELGSLTAGEEKHYVFKKIKITHEDGTIFFEDDFVSVKCTLSHESTIFIICLTAVNSGLKYILRRNIDWKRTILLETQTPSTMEHTLGVTTIGEEGAETEFDINLINLEKPNLNNFIFKGSVYISAVDWSGNDHPVYFSDTSVSIRVMGPYDDGSFYLELQENRGHIVTFYVQSDGTVTFEGDTGAPVYPGDLEYMLPIKRWNNKTITNAFEFEYEPQLYFLNNVNIRMTDGNSRYFDGSTATMYRNDYYIFIYDHTNCREVYLNYGGSSINSISADRLFTSISNATVKRVDYPSSDKFIDLRRVFGNIVGAILITPGFNALNSNGELIAFKFGKYHNSLVYYSYDVSNKKFTIYSYEEMKTYTFSYSSLEDIPTLVSIESSMPAPDIDLTGYATKEYVDNAIENLGNFGGGDVPASSDQFNVVPAGSTITTLESLRGIFVQDKLNFVESLDVPYNSDILYDEETGKPQWNISSLHIENDFVRFADYDSCVELFIYKDSLRYNLVNSRVMSSSMDLSYKLVNDHYASYKQLSNVESNLNSQISDVNARIDNLDNTFGGVDLSNYATKEELFNKDYNELINKPEIPSVEGLATEQFVLGKIAEIEHPQYDDSELRGMIEGKANKEEIPSIEGLASEDYVNQKIDEIPEVDLSGYATKEELQNQLGSIDSILDAINGEVL